MSARPAARAAAVVALACGLSAVPGAPVHADDNVRVVYAVFTGTGSAFEVDGRSGLTVQVSAGTGECTAVVVVGTSVATPVTCSFSLDGSVNRVPGLCSGEGTIPGTLTVYSVPGYTYPHAFSYSMRVIVDEGSAYGFGGGGAGTYATFGFTSARCGVPGANRGMAEY